MANYCRAVTKSPRGTVLDVLLHLHQKGIGLGHISHLKVSNLSNCCDVILTMLHILFMPSYLTSGQFLAIVPHYPFFYFLNMQQSWAVQSQLHSNNKATSAQPLKFVPEAISDKNLDLCFSKLILTPSNCISPIFFS